MPKLLHKTNADVKPKGKPRVYFTCHPADFAVCFPLICKDFFRSHDCAIYYTEDMREPFSEEEADLLREYNLVVVPITRRLLTEPNRAMDADIPLALEQCVPILPVLMEDGLDALYAQPDKFGSLQYLNAVSSDTTEIAYRDKLKKYLDSVLISQEMAARIRAAFTARIFLSYRKKDRKHANELMRMIHSHPQCRDIAIWFDEFLTPGKSFSDSIADILKDSDLFALLVTPSILEEPKGKPNFVMGQEYPAARTAGIPILPVRMRQTDDTALSEKFEGIPACVDPANPEVFFRSIEQAVARFMLRSPEKNPVHEFLIGLAYLDGIDMEVDRQRALEMITGAARAQLPEAMEKLILMYTRGDGVSRDPEQACVWSKSLADYFYQQCFAAKEPDALSRLFAKYKEEHWAETIRQFLLMADARLDDRGMTLMWEQITQQGICEYSLLFRTAGEMTIHRSLAQGILLQDILTKSTGGSYPPYGPLFWYVPEFDLYEPLLCCLAMLTDHPCYAKMLALSRDVCWIFGQYHSAQQVTRKADPAALFQKADLWGVRRELCRLFFLGVADAAMGADVYPRCFNVREAKAFMDTGSGVLDVMSEPFVDELGLYEPKMCSVLDGEWIGISSLPYGAGEPENSLAAASGNKLRGLILTETDETHMGYFSCNRKHIEVLYVPENMTELSNHSRWREHMPLRQDVVRLSGRLFYFRGDACIPAGLESIRAEEFCRCQSLTSVTVPEGVKNLGWEAFEGCRSLHTVSLPDSLKMIDERAFAGCIRLRSVSFGKYLETLGSCAFYDCLDLERIDLPDSLKTIGAAAFQGCKGLKQVRLGSQLARISNNAFWSCDALEVLVLPGSLERLEKHAFAGCAGLKVLEGCPAGCSHSFLGLPETTEIRYRAGTLRKLTIPGTPSRVPEKAYYGDRDVESVTIEKGVSVLGKSAFAECSVLKTVNLPESLTHIGSRCFAGCGGLTEIRLPAGVETVEEGLFMHCSSLRAVFLPDSVASIEDYAFSNCAGLERIALPAGLKRLGRKAFSGCGSLTEVIFPDDLQQVEEYVFEACTALKILYNCPTGCSPAYLGLGDDVRIVYREETACKQVADIPEETVGDRQYAHRRDISGLQFSETVTKIGNQSFLCCASLETLSLPQGVTEVGKEAFRQCTALREVCLPDSVTKLQDAAFAGCSSLEKVRLSPNMEYLRADVFRGCVSLRSVTVPVGVKGIWDHAFSGCTGLTEIGLPEGLEGLGGAFRDCVSLRQVTIPDSVEELGWHTFAGCSALETVTMPKKLTYLGRWAFQGCSALRSLVFPEGLDMIERYVCQDCVSLTRVEIPATVTFISRRAFTGCSALETLYIPESVRDIEDNAFAGCTGLKRLTLPEIFKDSLGDIFPDTDLSDTEIHWL